MKTVKKVIFALPNMSSGGAERVVSILANNLVKRGVKVEIWLYYGLTLHYQLDKLVQVDYLDLENFSIRKRIAILHSKLKQVKQKERDIVFIPFLGAILNISVVANLGTGIPLVACERNNPYIHGTTLLQKIKAQIPFLMATHCVFQTPDARDYYSLVSSHRCSVIINPITQSSYNWKGVLSPSRLISVCRLHKQKNLPMTFDVVELLKQKIPDLHIDIYGDGDLKYAIEDEIDKRGLAHNVSLMGVTKNVPFVLSNASVFISTSDFEGISNSMLEAMSVGMPLLCTDCPIGGARLMLKDGAGILSPIKDAELFANSLEELLSNHKKATELGAKEIGRAHV